MYSYDWFVLVTLDLDRWEQERAPKPHELDLIAARERHEAARHCAPATPGVQARLRRMARCLRRRQEASVACASPPSVRADS